MKPKTLTAIALTLFAGYVAQATNSPAPAQAAATPAPTLRIVVDPRVELLSLIFRLAGNPEYNQARVESYATDAEKQFAKFQDHQAVQLAGRLRKTRAVSYDACMSLAVHLTDADMLQTRIPLEPWPESLDQRWTVSATGEFLEAAREFVQDTAFKDFLAQHQPLYATTESRMKALMEKEGHLPWFAQYFGERPQATFTLALGLLNGGCCYGPHFRDATGQEELYCILGVWQTDGEGLPVFTRDMLSTVVHEFGHSYANPIIYRHLAELEPSGKVLFERVAKRMRSQAYGNVSTMLHESLVRASTVRYLRQYEGTGAAQRAIQSEIKRGFLWMQELSGLLGEYEAHRDQYPTLESFSPKLVAFFKEYAAKLPQTQTQAAPSANRPKVAFMVPANGATDVDPALAEIRVLFDRPMKAGCWALVGGGPHCPETSGSARYDAQCTTWTVPVKLKPNWTYEFSLNSEAYDSFQSAAGMPLEPVSVTFKTAGPKSASTKARAQ